MTEQELRTAVAEYDAELARTAVYDQSYAWLEAGGIWTLSSDWTERREGVLIVNAARRPNAATMRAMDAAAKAFQEALK